MMIRLQGLHYLRVVFSFRRSSIDEIRSDEIENGTSERREGFAESSNGENRYEELLAALN